MKTLTLPKGLTLTRPLEGAAQDVLTPEALEFLVRLQHDFGPTRDALLKRRAAREARLKAGERPDFLVETRNVREASWRVAPPPADLKDRRVEITGPTDRKMMINALNSGAKVFMADFEDANTPAWSNLVEGQVNLIDAIERRLEFTSPDGKEYRLKPKVATLVVRPRGWHLAEKHVLVDGKPMSGSLFDFGLYAFHNAKRLLAKGTGPYFYLPKMESHLEARLWDNVFTFAERELKLPKGSIRATVLLETVLAAFEMDEILHELRDHSAGLNAGRWDYLFSVIKKFRHDSAFVLPDRAQLTMTVPFMRAYTELLVQTCHKRGAHAMGGMAAFVPSRKDPQVNEVALTKVREDKVREARDGFDGTWVAHPDLVPVAMEVFDGVLGAKPNQVDRQRPDVRVSARELLDVRVPNPTITEAGLRNNVSVGLQYLESWLRGSGAVAIFNLMEDAATAEIARSQVWQWIRHNARLADGRPVTTALVRAVLSEELAKIREAWGEDLVKKSQLPAAATLFDRVALQEGYVEFLTLTAYELVD